MVEVHLGKVARCKSWRVGALSFRGHLTKSVWEQLRKCITDLAVIIGGVIGKLEPLDISANRPFKWGVGCIYTEWMATTTHQKTPTGRLERTSLTEMCPWTFEAWYAVSFRIVEKSFKLMGILNKLDGTENNLIWVRREGGVQPSSKDNGTNEECSWLHVLTKVINAVTFCLATCVSGSI